MGRRIKKSRLLQAIHYGPVQPLLPQPLNLLGGQALIDRSRTTDIIADAAYYILRSHQPHAQLTFY